MQLKEEDRGPLLLALLRITIGWLLLWGFLDKLFGLGYRTPWGEGMLFGYHPTEWLKYSSGGILGDFWQGIEPNLPMDLLLMAGLLLVGLCLILGVASKIATIATVAFMLCMFSLWMPPQDNPVLDYHIILAVAALAIYYLHGFERYSVYGWYKGLWIVRDHPILARAAPLNYK